MRAFAIAALALSTSACGAGGSDASGAASPFSSSSSSSGEAPAQPFLVIQPEDARLAIAAQNLKAGIGHEVQVDFDASLLKDHAANLQTELADALETISRGLEAARAQRPDIVLRATATLGTLKFVLDEKIREHYAILTEEGGVDHPRTDEHLVFDHGRRDHFGGFGALTPAAGFRFQVSGRDEIGNIPLLS